MLKPGIRYNLVSNDGSIIGYLLDDFYYEDDHRMGGIKDGLFYYELNQGMTGTPTFPGDIGGHLEGMEIVRVGDGVRFQLIEAKGE